MPEKHNVQQIRKVCSSSTLPGQTVCQKQIAMTGKAFVKLGQFSGPKTIYSALQG
jgi:hypothetical protein